MNKNKIILYYPIATNYFQSLPYSLLYLERMVRDMNVDVEIYDEKTDDNIITYLEKHASEILFVGLSVMMSYQIISARKFAEQVKKRTSIPVLFGGWFVTTVPELVLREDFVDFIIRGQGEIPFRQLTEALLSNQQDLHHIKGLGYKNGNNIIINDEQKWSNLFEFPCIDFDKIKLENYTEHNNTTLQYLATTGCNCNCNFCMLSALKGSKHYPNTVENILFDLVYLKKRIPQLKYIKFNDDNFFSNRKFVLSLCKAMINSNINTNWCASANVKQFHTQYSDEDIDLITRAGCDLIYMGAESGDNNVLKNINKKYTADTITNVLKILKKHHIKVAFSFMIAFPPDPYVDFDKTVRFIMTLYRITTKLDVSIKIYLPAMSNIYHDEASKLGFKMPRSYVEYEEKIKQGFNIPWIKNDISSWLFYFTAYYIPVFKHEIPVNSDPETHKMWKRFFFWHYPLVWLRFLFKNYKHNFDAKAALKKVSWIENKHQTGSNTNDLNNFMHGSTRIEK